MSDNQRPSNIIEVILGELILFLLLGVLLMFSWNKGLATMVAIPTIEYSQALWLLIFLSVLGHFFKSK